jgi:rhodanese-related sulfurtransferase
MRTITVQELKSRMDAGEQLHIVDVREPAEYAEFNINGILVPLGKIANMQTEELEELRGEELILHCKAGMRSMQACMILEQMGFTNVVNLEGGMMAWQQFVK